ncbi:helix-turn-helix domain-containing protein [Novosphingobium sp. 1949]|uniref:Helix-turn-helix domain-containing protein n=1 Tax=Novosphingobium organovorum TaxID=2930092 RepID=A0ABT0BIW7_9SPHN|nr:helix-turn-helix domain-containing protein [Novosphingobium organovorum]MCJ2184987.1 helix-turn-helix domain-containing protein [Novosphingobium organovorum]
MPPTAIPTYLLYGEDPAAPPPQFAHIETIAARSALCHWEIRAHRHRHSVQVLIVSKGQVEFHCDGVIETLDGPCFMAVPIGSVHAFRFEAETTGFVLSLSPAFLNRAQGAEDAMLAILTHGASGAITPTAHARVGWICEELLAIQRDWQEPGALFVSLADALVRSLEPTAPAPTAEPRDDRLAQFRKLVELHLTEHRAIAWYAERLGISAKTLTRICRRQIDCTPIQLLHNRLVLEAQRLLCFTDASVVSVAETLGFCDPSYFSRFYQRLTGRRPQHDKAEARTRG